MDTGNCFDACRAFVEAVKGFDKFEICADGKNAGKAKALRKAFIEKSGRFCCITGSEEFAHIGMMSRSPKEWAEIVLAGAGDKTLNRVLDTLYGMLAQGRTVLVVSEADPQIFRSVGPGKPDEGASVYRPAGGLSGRNPAAENLDKLFICGMDPSDLDADAFAALFAAER